MAGTENTQASEFPSDPDIYGTGTTNADEFRDIDLVSTAGTKPTTDFAAVPNETMTFPTEQVKERAAERRIYANGPEAISVARVSDQGARRYSAFSKILMPGSSGYPGEPVLLLGDDLSRTRIVITHGNTSYVILGPREQVSTGSGLFLPLNLLFESAVTQAIYAACPSDAVNPITLNVWAEYA